MGRAITVCVVDDDMDAATILCEGLKLLEYEAIAVHCGEDALVVCGEHDVDLVLLDVGLPDIDGYEVCRRLKSLAHTKDVPVIFVTVKGEQEDISRGYDLGAVDYITKPYNLPMVMIRAEAAIYGTNLKERPLVNSNVLMDVGTTDHLTGLRNRRYLLDRLDEEVLKAHRYDFPVSCVIIDIDEVRALDEEIGQVSVDDLLAEVALALKHHSRAHDVLARYDGSLFAAVLPHTVLDDALGYGRKILTEIDSTTFSDPNFPTKARASVGIVTCRNGSAVGADLVFGEAMRSLLESKGLHEEERITARSLD